MLVLSRKPGESITLAHPDWDYVIEFKVVEIRRANGGANLRIGITAPGEVDIRRNDAGPVRGRIEWPAEPAEVANAAGS